MSTAGLAPCDTADGSAFSNMMLNLGGSTGTVMLSTVIDRLKQFHFSVPAEFMTQKAMLTLSRLSALIGVVLVIGLGAIGLQITTASIEVINQWRLTPSALLSMRALRQAQLIFRTVDRTSGLRVVVVYGSRRQARNVTWGSGTFDPPVSTMAFVTNSSTRTAAMAQSRFRIGIVGLQPDRSWAARAHVPALRALPDDYEIIGVANSSRESGVAAAQALGIPRAFDSVADLVASPDVDVVAVTVKVPHHLELVSSAISAGKHVYCEWPLGNGLAEARRIADLARDKGVLGVAGTQARMAPEIRHLCDLVAEGYVGKVLSTTLVGTGGNWGSLIQKANAYTLDAENGATLLTIPLGHTLAAMIQALGPIVGISATLGHRRTSALNVDTGQTVPMTAADQVLAYGEFVSGAPLSIHYRGGTSRGPGLLWEINGTEGDLRISGPSGHAQMVQLSLSGGRGDDKSLEPLPLPAASAADADDGPVKGNVRRVYAAMARDLRLGTREAPSFEDAVAIHQVIAAIEAAARTHAMVRPDAM